MNRTFPLPLALLILTIASAAQAQGFYRNGTWRNPNTGQIEVNNYTQVYRPWLGTRSGSDFYGMREDPYTGAIVQSRVQRNPFTGRLDVANDYYSPYTGARAQTVTRFNPFTQQYETTQYVTPPLRLPPPSSGSAPAEAQFEAPQENAGNSQSKEPERPKIIETRNPLLIPKLPPDVKPQQTLPDFGVE